MTFLKSRALALVIVASPLVTTIVYIQIFATPTPLTDEGFFLKKMITVLETEITSGRVLWGTFATKLWNHVLTVPFALYRVLAPLTNFDNRVFVYVTLFAFCVHFWIFRSILGGVTLAMLPVSLILFTPAHYMEYHWGFEFTLAFSVVLPVVGLWLLDRALLRDARHSAGSIAGAMALFLLGALSSAGAVLAAPAAVVLVLLKRRPITEKVTVVGILLVVQAVAFYIVEPSTGGFKVAPREVLYVLTAMGGTVWGTPVGMVAFKVDQLSMIGALFCLVMAAVALRALALRRLPDFALCIALFFFSATMMASIAMNRPYLGNWHLQHLLPGLCAVYAASLLLYRMDNSYVAKATFGIATCLSAVALVGYYKGFTEYGPSYQDYVHQIEAYNLAYLEEPDRPTPFPSGTGHDVDADMVQFLSARNHPLFQPSNARILQAATNAGAAIGGEASIFADGRRLNGTTLIVGPRRQHIRMIVALKTAPRCAVLTAANLRRSLRHTVSYTHLTLPTIYSV